MRRAHRSQPPTAALTSYLHRHPDLAAWILGANDPADTDTLAAHIAGCADCRAVLEELERLPDQLAELAATVELPPGLESRILTAVRAAATQPPAHRMPAGSPWHARRPRRRGSAVRRRRLRHPYRGPR